MTRKKIADEVLVEYEAKGEVMKPSQLDWLGTERAVSYYVAKSMLNMVEDRTHGLYQPCPKCGSNRITDASPPDGFICEPFEWLCLDCAHNFPKRTPEQTAGSIENQTSKQKVGGQEQ